MVQSHGFEIKDVPFVAIGGGIGTFAMVDFLRVAGLPVESMTVVTPALRPYSNLESQLDNSQIPRDARIRSGSGDRMDSIWGWPGYGMEEAFRRRNPLMLLRLAAEPVLSEYYTPRASQLYDTMDREAARISWNRMVVAGMARVVRKRTEGGYFVVVDPLSPGPGGSVAVLSARYVHLSLGVAAVRHFPGFEGGADPEQAKRAVNVYEAHEHVYEEIRRHPGSKVLVRGAASSSMEVLGRLIADRDSYGTAVEIFHLYHSFFDGPKGPARFRIPGGNGFCYQPFTFAKGAFGGQLHRRYGALQSDAERIDLFTKLASTAIPKRKVWTSRIERGRREGWYHTVLGAAGCLESADGGDGSGHVRAHVEPLAGTGEAERVLEVDYVIDAAGVDIDLRKHSLLADLVDCGGARLNGLGQFAVDASFEIDSMHSGNGRLFASGFATLGNPYLIPMYSFWGYHYVAWAVHRKLAEDGFVRRLGTGRSVAAWWRRMRMAEP